MRSIKIFLLFLFTIIAVSSCKSKTESTNQAETQTPQTPLINYSVTNSFPHDTSLFTEGFLFYDGKLFESSGAPENIPFTRSLVVTDDLSTGKFDIKIEIDKAKYFGEGISFINNKLYQLTYKNRVCFVYDAKTFKRTDSFNYSNTEGWSLTVINNELVMDDGTDKLTFINPVNFKQIKTLAVTENGLPDSNLNELEYINGFIYANIWETNNIVKIDTATGNVVGKLDLTSLFMEAQNKHPNADVLNGIAYDTATDKIYVTGKLWPNIYEINFAH